MAGTPPDDPYDHDLSAEDPEEFGGPSELDRQPGRPSAEVYRRRRLAAGLAALVVLALLIGLVVWIGSLLGGSQEDPDDAPSPTVSTSPAASPTSNAPTSPEPSTEEPSSASASPTASGTQSPSPSVSESGSASASASADATASASPSATPVAQDCQPQDLSVSGATDQTSYAAEQDPVLELRIENVGEDPCRANVGTSQQVFTVTSGSDRIFSTEDCQVEGEDVQMTLEPGVQESARFTWDRTRSAPECAEVSSTPGAGTYRLVVSLGEITAQPVAFTLQ